MKGEAISDRFLTKAELSAALKVSERTIDNWRKRGVLNTVEIGKVLRFDWEDVVAKLTKYRRDVRAEVGER